MNQPSTMMQIHDAQEPLIYFGKLPSRGDFVRSNRDGNLTQTLDRWISNSLEQLAVAPDWKQHFDALPAIEFIIAGSRSSTILTGRMVASRDSSGRRYPFLIARSVRSDMPLEVLPSLPLCLLPAWVAMEQLIQSAQNATDIEEALERIDLAQLQIETDLAGIDERRNEYLQATTIGQVQQMLNAAGNTTNLRQSIIALGLLLLPLLTSGPGGATKGLALPLPGPASASAQIASFWLSLVAPFLARADHEISLLRTSLAGRPTLLLNLNGVSASSLESVFNPAQAFESNIDLCEADWTEDYIAGEYPINKLSSYLDHPDLSLARALTTFQEVFLGA
ncbi:MAG TPA: type VI secretion system-associated protein TagF [Rhodocyclaceae bacterium]|nr:type VI secretion system-associated protein TagF [Rhodocyclaceae bacterium]